MKQLIYRISILIFISAVSGLIAGTAMAGWLSSGVTYGGDCGTIECSGWPGTSPCQYWETSAKITTGLPTPDAEWTACCGGATSYVFATVTSTWTWDGGNPPEWAVVRVISSQSYGATPGAAVSAAYLTPTARWFTDPGNPTVRKCDFEVKYYTAQGGTITITWPTGCTATATNSSSGHVQTSAGYLIFNPTDHFTGPVADRTVVQVPGSTDWRDYFPRLQRFVPTHGGNGTADGDPVDLATGEDMYMPDPDIVVYNPYGPPAIYLRNFISRQAKAQPQAYHSPGLSDGWVETYDVRASSVNPSAWSDVTLKYPNSATEVYIPEVVNGQPTGKFTPQRRTNRYMTGDPSSTTGQWNWLKVTFKDGTFWTLTPTVNNTYMLTRITNRVGHHVSIERDPGYEYRVTAIRNDATQNNLLLQVTYDPASGYLSSVQDAYGRKVMYTFVSDCLDTVSQIGPSSSSSLPFHYKYGYSTVSGRPHLTSIESPNPTGSQTENRKQKINYNADGQVASLEDSNHNLTVFSYDSPDSTLVQVKNAQGNVEPEWRVSFDPLNRNISMGTTDAKGYSVSYRYEELPNNAQRRKIIDKNNNETSYVYDQFGNITEITDPRGTITTLTHEYPTEQPLGRPLSIKEGSKKETTLAYYSSGLVQSITTPKPGSTGPSAPTVTTSFTYDGLGNVLTVTAPGNDPLNPDATATTTYNYTTDGTYTQPAKIGQPLTVTDNLGHTAHFRYDNRGNVISAKDALSYETNFTFNIADQLTTTVYPSTQTP